MSTEILKIKCDYANCEKLFKYKSYLKSHKQSAHSIGVVWKYCNYQNCKSKFKTNFELKSHKQYIHNIGINWINCDQPK